MNDALKTVIQCHGTEAGETWEASLMRGETRIAFVTGISSHAQAREVAEQLRISIASGWRTTPLFADLEMQDAGVEAMECEPQSQDGAGDQDVTIIRAVWSAMVEVWHRKMRAAAGLDS